jgi:hypothetical protein
MGAKLARPPWQPNRQSVHGRVIALLSKNSPQLELAADGSDRAVQAPTGLMNDRGARRPDTRDSARPLGA